VTGQPGLGLGARQKVQCRPWRSDVDGHGPAYRL